MSDETEAAAEAAEASAEAAEAAAEAAEAEAEAESDDGDQGDDGDTTVVVVDGDDGDAEAAQDDATNLDHEQRITRLEERFGGLESEIFSRPSRDEVAAMIPSPETVAAVAEETAAATAEAVVEATEEAEETGEPASVRIEEPPPSDPLVDGGMVTVEPDVPAPKGERRRPALFRW